MRYERRGILVAGMHRSGTSAVTRILNLLGAELPGELLPAYHGNELGHWEPREIVKLHDRMLSLVGSEVNSVFDFAPDALDSETMTLHVDAISAFLRSSARGPLWVIKDPRMSLFLPLWLRAMAKEGIDPLIVIPFRHPLEVARSLRRRQTHFYPDAAWSTGRAMALWLRYVLASERGSRGVKRSFISYESLLSNYRAEVHRLGEQLELDLSCNITQAADIEAFLDPGQRHETVPNDISLPSLVKNVYEVLQRSVQAPTGNMASFDQAGRLFAEASDLFREYVVDLEQLLASNSELRTDFHLGRLRSCPPVACSRFGRSRIRQWLRRFIR